MFKIKKIIKNQIRIYNQIIILACSQIRTTMIIKLIILQNKFIFKIKLVLNYNALFPL